MRGPKVAARAGTFDVPHAVPVTILPASRIAMNAEAAHMPRDRNA
jgi:hypothetical protein